MSSHWLVIVAQYIVSGIYICFIVFFVKYVTIISHAIDSLIYSDTCLYKTTCIGIK